jgi:putative Mn2+ efflux pump MntP
LDVFTVFAVAIGLAADAFAVSVANGIVMKDNYKIYYSLIFGLYFGLFQFIMPLIGYFTGSLFSESFEHFSNWVAFGLLFFIGAKMVYEALKNEAENEIIADLKHMVSVRNMCFLAIAVSIDAGAVGVSFAFTGTPLLQSSIIIGVVAFVGSAFGVYLGYKAGELISKGAGVVGGVILVLIGFSMIWL